MLVLTHKYTKLKAIHNKPGKPNKQNKVGANAQIYKIESNSQQYDADSFFKGSWC